MWFDKRPVGLFVPHTLENYGYVGIKPIGLAREMVLRVIAKRVDIRWVIRLRPNLEQAPKTDDRWYYNRWMKQVGCRVTIDWKTKPAKLIKEAAFLVVQHSSMAVDALVMSKPIIVIEDEVSDVTGIYQGYEGAFDMARDEQGLQQAIERSLFLRRALG